MQRDRRAQQARNDYEKKAREDPLQDGGCSWTRGQHRSVRRARSLSVRRLCCFEFVPIKVRHTSHPAKVRLLPRLVAPSLVVVVVVRACVLTFIH